MSKIQRYSNGCYQYPDETAVVGWNPQPDTDFVTMEVAGAESMLGFDPREAIEQDDYED